MKIIDRHILMEFFRIFFMSMIVLVVFYEMVTFIDRAGYFFKFKAPFDAIARYMLLRVPMAMFHVTPICVLLGSVLVISALSRYNELTAMKSSGMSMLRVAAPIIVASSVISGAAFLDSEYLFHLAAKETKRIYFEEIKRQERKALFSKDQLWYRADDGSIWNIGKVEEGGKHLRELSIFRFDESGGRITSRVNAAEGRLERGVWVLSGYVERGFTPDGAVTEKRMGRFELPESAISAEDLNKVKLDPEEMNLAQIKEYIADIKEKGYDPSRYVIDMHAKIGFPLITLIMPLFAIPMGVRSNRSGGVLVGIGVAVVIGVVFWFCFSMGLAFGRAGRLPPMVAAYGAHVVFGLSGLYMLLTDRQ